MPAVGRVQRTPPQPLSRRERANRRILRLSILAGALGAVLTVLAYVALAYPVVLYCRALNLRALSEITCEGLTCDSGSFSTDWQLDGRVYVVDTETKFVLSVAAPGEDASGSFAPLDYSDRSFLARFRRPTSYSTPDGEVWRLYSQTDKKLEIIVGYAVKAPWKAIETPISLFAGVDTELKRAADKIAGGLSSATTSVRPQQNIVSVDGFQAVDSTTQRVIEQGPSLPAFLPEGVPVPPPGLKLCLSGGNLRLARTDRKGRLSATSLAEIGDIRLIICLCTLGFAATGAVGHALGRLFPPSPARTPTLAVALNDGEGQTVEFKRGLSENENRAGEQEDEVLRSVAAFANTNDGVIFLGIDDYRHIKGLALDHKGRDRLEQKLRGLIKDRIRPIPPVQITFEDMRDLVVARVAVAGGGDPPYMMSGVIYIRRGSSDVQAQPEDVKRLLSRQRF
jgi:hypothetical protein